MPNRPSWIFSGLNLINAKENKLYMQFHVYLMTNVQTSVHMLFSWEIVQIKPLRQKGKNEFLTFRKKFHAFPYALFLNKEKMIL